MHEKDHLDRMLDSALSNYGDSAEHGAEQGLAERILARVSSEENPYRSAPRWRSRFLVWAALPAAACLLLTFLLLKSAGPRNTQQSARLPQAASSSAENNVPKVADGLHAQKTRIPERHYTQPRSTSAVAKSDARPKLDVFPRPQPLSPEEQALYAFATQVPEEQRQAVLAAQKGDDAPLNIVAIRIQPLDISDTGKN